MRFSSFFLLLIAAPAPAQTGGEAPAAEPTTPAPLPASLPQGNAPPAPAPPRCDNSESREFDFWVGEWNVIDLTSGRPAGVSHIERLYGGCVLRENWTSPGFRGGSLNGWSSADRRWHQTWMDQAGAVRHFRGGIEAGRMVLTAEVPDPNDPQAGMLVRMTFTANPDGTVRQYSDLSRDGGATWQLRYDFLYRKMD